MIVKSKYVSAPRVSAGKASSALKSHLKYIQYRERDELKESRQDRHLFCKEHDHVDRRAAHDAIMTERAGAIYYHRMVLSPSEEEPVTDWRDWTRDVMRDLERYLGTELCWYGVVHQNTDNPHVHVVVRGTGTSRETGEAEPVTLTPAAFSVMKASGREHSEYEQYHQMQELFKELDQAEQTERLFQREYALTHHRDSYEFDR
jgi:hypothetical protein